ncbi:MAG TPA: hypothetical protein PKE26_02640 [Kiritimatiellia bacterium]|nr:hypothetical protein [Kiritimatiellia bacterium]HMO97986.1 hypothetical protein [Kiritimatiellia bacterium]HMP95337.1 hypothetical protein [Kiritimatiellia bacterium]
MRGSPFIQWSAFAALWLLLLIPIVRVTRPEALAPGNDTIRQTDTEKHPAWVSLRFSRLPESFTLLHLDETVWTETQPRDRYLTRIIPLALDRFGTELHLIAELPDGETAVEITVEPDGRERRAQTLWITGPADDPVFFTWGIDD